MCLPADVKEMAREMESKTQHKARLMFIVFATWSNLNARIILMLSLAPVVI